MTLKFKSIEVMDGNLNKEMLADYRNDICNRDDVKATFRLITRYRQRGDPRWIDLYANLARTISNLKSMGCNVNKLNKEFGKCERLMVSHAKD